MYRSSTTSTTSLIHFLLISEVVHLIQFGLEIFSEFNFCLKRVLRKKFSLRSAISALGWRISRKRRPLSCSPAGFRNLSLGGSMNSVSNRIRPNQFALFLILRFLAILNEWLFTRTAVCFDIGSAVISIECLGWVQTIYDDVMSESGQEALRGARRGCGLLQIWHSFQDLARTRPRR